MNAKRSEMKCENCQCWEKKDNGYGVCHKYPPSVDKEVETHGFNWCFEFMPNYQSRDYKY